MVAISQKLLVYVAFMIFSVLTMNLIYLSVLVSSMPEYATTFALHSIFLSFIFFLCSISIFFHYYFNLCFPCFIGIDCGEFKEIFNKCSTIVSTVRGSQNIYRRLHDDQVCFD